jgi:hypothetical protein
MTTRFHGLTSLELIFLAITLAAVAIFMSAWLLGISYLVAGVVGLTGLLYAYCAKCPCRTHCGHVIPGKIVRSIFPHRQPGPYSLIELAVLGLALLLLLGLPQIWLWQFTGLFLAFWLLTAIALIQIRMIICRTCDNIYCPARLRQG